MKPDTPAKRWISRWTTRKNKGRQLSGRFIASNMVRRQYHQKGSRPRPQQAVPELPQAVPALPLAPAQVGLDVPEVIPVDRPQGVVNPVMQEDVMVQPAVLEALPWAPAPFVFDHAQVPVQQPQVYEADYYDVPFVPDQVLPDFQEVVPVPYYEVPLAPAQVMPDFQEVVPVPLPQEMVEPVIQEAFPAFPDALSYDEGAYFVPAQVQEVVQPAFPNAPYYDEGNYFEAPLVPAQVGPVHQETISLPCPQAVVEPTIQETLPVHCHQVVVEPVLSDEANPVFPPQLEADQWTVVLRDLESYDMF